MRDSQLIEKFKDGDGRAWQIVYDSVFEDTCHFISNLVNDKSIAEEIVNDSFLSIRDKNYQYDDLKGLKALINEIAYNKSIDHIRKRKREDEKLKEYQLIEEQSKEMDDVRSFEEDRAKLYESIIQELNEQPPQRKKVAIEHYVNGTSPKDIAKAMHIHVSTVYKHLEELEKVLKNKYDTEKNKHLYP